MQRTSTAWFPVVAIGCALPLLGGCDKIKSTTAKLAKPKAAETAAPAMPASPDQIVEVTKAGYDSFVARKNALVLIDYTATWCGPCKQLSPVLEKAVAAHPGVLYVGKVDVDKSPDLAQAQGVGGIPDVRIFKDGKQVDRFVGFTGEQAVLAKLAAHAEGIRPAAVEAAPPSPKSEIAPADKNWLPQGMQRR